MLALLRPYLATASSALPIAAGDDAAAWVPPPGEVVVVTTDTLVEDVHFRRPQVPSAAESLGWKLLAVSLSDLAAMGATPGPAFISLSVPGGWPAGTLVQIYQGLSQCASVHGALLAGGNLSESATPVLTSTCLGSVEPGRALVRTGARPGWALAVTGRVGGAAAALAVAPAGSARDRWSHAWQRRLDRPEPRLRGGRLLLAAGVPLALDVSDGLFVDAARLVAGPDRGFAGGLLIDSASLPLEPGLGEVFGDESLRVAGGGEDYELLFAGPEDRVADAVLRMVGDGMDATRIGQFDDGNGLRLLREGKEVRPPATGHAHFRRR
ncbi:MAG: thiamine-phosphate kinase [Candidatus Dormibacteria bacterium]